MVNEILCLGWLRSAGNKEQKNHGGLFLQRINSIYFIERIKDVRSGFTHFSLSTTVHSSKFACAVPTKKTFKFENFKKHLCFNPFEHCSCACFFLSHLKKYSTSRIPSSGRSVQ